MLTESEPILCGAVRGSYTLAQVKCCKHIGLDSPGVIFGVFYSLTEECYLNLPPKAQH